MTPRNIPINRISQGKQSNNKIMKKLHKLTMLLLTLTMSTSLIAQTPTPPANGDGSSGNPYQIATLNNLC